MADHSTLIGGSTCERVMNCPGSVALVAAMPPLPSSSYADEGTMLHEVMPLVLAGVDPYGLVGKTTYGAHTLTEDHIVELIDPALAAFDRLIEELDDGDLDFKCEVRIAYPGLNAFGTSDILGTTKNYVVVADWKFGRGVKVRAEGNLQWRFYAGGAWAESERLFKNRRVVGAIIQPAAEDPLSYEIIELNDLLVFVSKMQTTLELIKAGANNLAAGKWCRWCAGAPVCPVKVSAAQELVSKAVGPSVDPAELGRLMTLATDLEGWTSAVKALSHAEAEKGRVIEGWKLVAKRAIRSWTSDDDALAMLSGILAEDCWITESVVTPAQAEKILKTKKLDPELLKEVTVSRSSGTTLARADDKRPEVKSKFDGSPLNLPART